MLEAKYQQHLKEEITRRWPRVLVLKTDPNYIQGFPDLLLFHLDKWAALEVKVSISSPQQPNQDWWVNTLNEMSYASFIFPENEEQIIHELESALGLSRTARFFEW